MILTRTPLRISLIGGSTDIPDFYNQHPCICTSFAINKYIYIMLNERFDGKYRLAYSQIEVVDKVEEIQHNLIRDTLKHYMNEKDKSVLSGLEITSIADIPGGTGLGSSSAYLVGLIKAIQDRLGIESDSKTALANHAHKIESISNPGIGKQDHFAAAYGGFQRYLFKRDFDAVERVQSKWDCANPWNEVELEKNMLLLWTGISRSSNAIMTDRKKGFASGETIPQGKELVELAIHFIQYLESGEVEKAAKYITAGWELKKSFAPGISNDQIDGWINAALNNGAWGGKLCGAGGGGFLFFFAPHNAHKRIVKATGLRQIDFKIEHEGSVSIERQGWGDF